MTLRRHYVHRLRAAIRLNAQGSRVGWLAEDFDEE